MEHAYESTPVADVAAWKNRAVHNVTLPSGAAVKIKIPNLTALIRNDVVPSKLREAAVAEVVSPGRPLAAAGAPVEGETQGRPTVDEETVKQLYDLYEFLVCEMLVSPEIKAEDLDELPQLDLDMLTQFALRERDVDARGVRLGVAPASRIEAFKEAHNCPDECAECERALESLSTVR